MDLTSLPGSTHSPRSQTPRFGRFPFPFRSAFVFHAAFISLYFHGQCPGCYSRCCITMESALDLVAQDRRERGWDTEEGEKEDLQDLFDLVKAGAERKDLCRLWAFDEHRLSLCLAVLQWAADWVPERAHMEAVINQARGRIG